MSEDRSPKKAKKALLSFSLGEYRLALPLDHVERVFRAAAISLLPEAPRGVRGVINLAGEVLPVCDLREKFGLSRQKIDPSHRFIIIQRDRGPLVLLVDAISEVVNADSKEIISFEELREGKEKKGQVVLTKDCLLYIPDINQLLSEEEDIALDKLLSELLAKGEGG